MTALDPRTADRLTKLLGLLSSNHDGEVINAARMADKLLREHGFTWGQIITVRPMASASSSNSPITVKEQIDFALRNGAAVLTAKEWTFVTDIADWPKSLSEKQRQWLGAIVAKVKAARCAA